MCEAQIRKEWFTEAEIFVPCTGDAASAPMKNHPKSRNGWLKNEADWQRRSIFFPLLFSFAPPPPVCASFQFYIYCAVSSSHSSPVCTMVSFVYAVAFSLASAVWWWGGVGGFVLCSSFLYKWDTISQDGFLTVIFLQMKNY